MQIDPTVTSSTDPATGDNVATQGVHAPGLQVFVFALFFIFGGITSLNDVIIPKLKELFTLNFFQASLVQVWFFVAYAIIGLPGAKLVKRIGYMRGAVAGLTTMIVGCLLFIPASRTATFGMFRRLKVHLSHLTWADIKTATDRSQPLRVKISMKDRRGEPLCASVRPDNPALSWQ